MSDYVVKLNRGTEFQVESGSNLLRSALRSGLGFPYECGSGGCGSCQFELLRGEVESAWADAPGLSAQARAANRHLACQTRVLSDCEIKVRLKPQYIAPIAAVQRRVRLVERKDLSADMAEYSFQSDGAAEFLPGQFALLNLPGVTGERAYSMSNLPNPEGLWRFIIKRVPDGKGTGYISSVMQIGDEIGLDGPYGMAYLKSDTRRDIVCIGGGSGLSPLKSILAGALGDQSMAGRNIWLFYGGRTAADICLEKALEELPESKSRIRIETAVSAEKPDSNWPGRTGFIHKVVGDFLDSEDGIRGVDCDFYFCGPPPMTDAVQILLAIEKRIPLKQLHFDRFF